MEDHGFTPMQQVSVDASAEKKESNLKRLPFRDFRLLIIIFVLILVEQIFRKNNYLLSLDLNKFIKSSETKEILSAVIPYLDEDEQKNVYTLLGLLEALDTIYGVADGTYQELKVSSTPILFRSEKERIVGILSAVKPYISEPSKELVDNIVKAQSMSSQLARNMRVYKSKRLSGESLLENLDTVYDTLEILQPIIPHDKYEQIDKAVGMAKLLETSVLKDQISPKEHTPKTDTTEDVPATNQDDNLETIMKMINLFSQMSGNS